MSIVMLHRRSRLVQAVQSASRMLGMVGLVLVVTALIPAAAEEAAKEAVAKTKPKFSAFYGVLVAFVMVGIAWVYGLLFKRKDSYYAD